jgi:hypothetical protein
MCSWKAILFMSSKSSVHAISLAAAVWAAPGVALGQSETHANVQAVTEVGTSAWNGTLPFTLRGVLLCHPDEMLNSTPNFAANPANMGGEWQITLQAVGPEDRGGTTCWMGQNYGSLAWVGDELSYTDEAWVSEVLRLNHDPSTGRPFRAGDLIEVMARRSLFYGGKRNINEAHDLEPEANFDLRLVTPAYGLPAPEVITLADVMQPGGVADDRATWTPIFDQTRATGGERYQGTRVRLQSLTLLDATGWNSTNVWANRLCTVTDGLGRFLSLRHPRHDLGPAPAAAFDAIGIFSQESSSGSQGTNGYELFVQQVIPQGPPPELTIGLNVTVAWPAAAADYQLEWRAQADSGDWAPVPTAPVAIHGTNTVILPPTSAQQFYQLRKPN